MPLKQRCSPYFYKKASRGLQTAVITGPNIRVAICLLRHMRHDSADLLQVGIAVLRVMDEKFFQRKISI